MSLSIHRARAHDHDERKHARTQEHGHDHANAHETDEHNRHQHALKGRTVAPSQQVNINTLIPALFTHNCNNGNHVRILVVMLLCKRAAYYQGTQTKTHISDLSHKPPTRILQNLDHKQVNGLLGEQNCPQPTQTCTRAQSKVALAKSCTAGGCK